MVEDNGEIFVKGNLTDFEKLIWARGEILELKKKLKERDIEVGQLKSHIDELIDLKISNTESVVDLISPELLTVIKTDLVQKGKFSMLNENYNKLTKKYTKLRTQIEELGYELSSKGNIKKY